MIAGRLTILRWLIAFAILNLAGSSFAATLRIGADGDLRLETAGEESRLVGRYTIRNDGEEPVLAVFPEIELGSFRWKGEPADLALGASRRWEINLLVSKQALSCAAPLQVASDRGESRCLEADFPVRGNIPLVIVRNYQDLNRHPVSAPELVILESPELTPAESSEMKTGLVLSTITVHSSGQSFDGELELKNTGKEKLTGVYTLILPHELTSETANLAVSIPSESSLRIPIRGQNVSGTPGSRYQLATLVQWRENGLRRVIRTVAEVQVYHPGDHGLLSGAAGAILIGALTFLWAVIRRSEKEKKATRYGGVQ